MPENAMAESRVKPRLLLVVAAVLCVGISGLLGIHESFPTGCIMTYMYPTYVPVPPLSNSSAATKYGLFLYHEGWKKIDYGNKLLQLSGVPVLFIPGNGGSYKQVRSIAAESDRAFNGGPLERSFYQTSDLTQDELGYEANGLETIDWADAKQGLHNLEKEYPNCLDWFTVDLDGEHSAMDGRILEEHTEYVVQAIHRILDRYKGSFEARTKDTNQVAKMLPTSVILVGHSMGGFVARAAVVHEGLRKGAVQTVITLSSPHLSPPVATQPSLGYYFSRVNRAWRNGYGSAQRSGWRSTTPSLSHVVVVSVVGGPRDYQVRSKMASLDGIVPSTHGLTIGAPGMLNVWLGMEHQSILWCNQLVVQVSHTLLQIIDKKTGQPFTSHSKRLKVFVNNLRSALPQTFGWMRVDSQDTPKHLHSKHTAATNGEDAFHSKFGLSQPSCPKSMRWSEESHEKDLYIETHTVTVLAMDGRRRWLDIRRLGSDGRGHFVLVTNLIPCTGIKIHLWPEKQGKEGLSINTQLVEVTRKMVQLPAGPAPRQSEPGGQTEQAPPSGILHLSPEDLRGFRFLTITVAPRPTISGRPPPSASMAVGQFYNPNDGAMVLSSSWIVSTLFVRKEIQLAEHHPLIFNFSFSASMGILPPTMELKTSSCGIETSVFANEGTGDRDHTSLCKLRCFPPVVLVWDPFTGLAVIPNFHTETIAVDSSPALWGSRPNSKEQSIILLVDPHCSYKISMAVSISTVATRFLVIHGLQIAGFAVAILLFILMQQARAWELDQPVPSVLASMEYNLTFPIPFVLLSTIPLLTYAFLGWFNMESTPSFVNFVLVTVACFCFATGAVALLAMITQVVFYALTSTHIYLKLRSKAWLQRTNVRPPFWFQAVFKIICSSWVVGYIRSKPSLAAMALSILLILCVHPALGLIILLFAHTWSCYSALCSQQNDNSLLQTGQALESEMAPKKTDGSPKALISFGETQLEMFNYGQGLLLLHLIATAMLIPSLVAWGQRLGMNRSFPWFLDASLSLGIIWHGYMGNKLDVNIPLIRVPCFSPGDSGLSLVYAFAGFYSYLAGLALAPYRVFYCLAAIGVLSAIFRVLERRGRTKGDYGSRRRHFHRH